MCRSSRRRACPTWPIRLIQSHVRPYLRHEWILGPLFLKQQAFYEMGVQLIFEHL